MIRFNAQGRNGIWACLTLYKIKNLYIKIQFKIKERNSQIILTKGKDFFVYNVLQGVGSELGAKII
jgi:hypothetical protein